MIEETPYIFISNFRPDSSKIRQKTFMIQLITYGFRGQAIEFKTISPNFQFPASKILHPSLGTEKFFAPTIKNTHNGKIEWSVPWSVTWKLTKLRDWVKTKNGNSYYNTGTWEMVHISKADCWVHCSVCKRCCLEKMLRPPSSSFLKNTFSSTSPSLKNASPPQPNMLTCYTRVQLSGPLLFCNVL